MIPFLNRVFGSAENVRHARPGAVAKDLRLRKAIEAAPIGLAISSVDGHWLWFNEACCSILGYTRDELSRITLRDVTHADDAAREIRLLRELLQGDVPSYRVRKRVIDKRGNYHTINVSASLVRVSAGEPWLLVYSIEPLTNDGDTGHDADRLSTLILDQISHAAVVRTDSRGIITGWNRGATRMFGYTPQQIIGRDRRSLYRDEDNWADKPAEHLRTAIESGTCESEEWRVRGDGNHLWVNSVVTRYAPDGMTRGFVEVIIPAVERDAADTREELIRLRAELDKERRSNEALTKVVSELEAADALHVRELRILATALKKEQAQRKNLSDAVRMLQTAADSAAVALPIRGPASEVVAVSGDAYVDSSPVDAAVPDEPAQQPRWQPLGDRPLLDLITEIEAQGRTGLLALSNGQQQRGIFFSRGAIVACASSDESSALGPRLVRMDWITDGERRKALETSEATRLPFGRALLLLGFLDETRIAAAIRHKIEDDIATAVRWNDPLWSFIEQPEEPAKLIQVALRSADLRHLDATATPATMMAAAPAPAGTTPLPTADLPLAAVTFVAARGGAKYHLPTCGSARRIAGASRVAISSPAEAEARDLSPCRQCLPVLPIACELDSHGDAASAPAPPRRKSERTTGARSRRRHNVSH